MENIINITSSAKEEIKKMGGSLKISISSGGCSGFVYHFSIPAENDICAEDWKITDDGIVVFVDNAVKSFFLGNDMCLDYKNSIQETGFFIQNNLKEFIKCGCGKSVDFK